MIVKQTSFIHFTIIRRQILSFGFKILENIYYFFVSCIAIALLDCDVPVLMTNFPSILDWLIGVFEKAGNTLSFHNIPLAEFVLRIITDKPDLIITDCETI